MLTGATLSLLDDKEDGTVLAAWYSALSSDNTLSQRHFKEIELFYTNFSHVTDNTWRTGSTFTAFDNSYY